MSRKLLWVSVLLFLLISIGLTFGVQKVATDGTIYIRASGLVQGTDKIVSADNVTYTFTDDINDSISIERNDIILDGADFSLIGTGSSSGVYFTNRNNITVRNINMNGFSTGVYLGNSTHCSVIGNKMENVTNAVYVGQDSNFNSISENIITSNQNGIYIRESSNCTVSNNNITCEREDNKFGIYLYFSSDNTVNANNITESQACIYVYYSDHSNLNGNNLTNSGRGQDGGGVWVERSHFNIIHGNFISESNWHGIELFRSSNSTVSENTIISNQNRGIMVRTDSNYNNITGNTVNDNYKGIESTSSAHNNIINGNSLSANTYEGIILDYSWNNTVSGNNIADNNPGIIIGGSSDYNNVTDNNITDCGQAIFVNQGSYNNLYRNNMTNNYFGLAIQSSTGNTLRENTVLNNTCGFTIRAYNLSHFTNYVDESNTVDHKPIYYWIDEHYSSVPEDAACVILVECSNITVQNLNMSICNYQGVALAYSQNITIADNHIVDNDQYAVWLWNSSECYVARNYLKGFIGIQLEHSSNNTFVGNTLTSGGNRGSVNLAQSSNNTFYHNNFTDNYFHYLIDEFSFNNWDDNYPSGGNYWDNYEDRYPSAKDEKSGPYQNITGSDNIWDVPYTLDSNNIDHYPIIPEFPSLIILLPFMIVTLLAFAIHGKKKA